MWRRSLPLAICIALACPRSGPVFADSLPVRKPGLWAITTVADNFGMQQFQTCINAGDAIVPGIGDEHCDTPEIKSANSEAIVNVTCHMKGGAQYTSSLLSGDFQKWYRATSKITFKFADGRESRDGVQITAKYVGHCPSDGKNAD